METKKEAFDAIRNLAKETAVQLKGLQENLGDYNKPVNADLVKTTKAMFYEKTLEILRQFKEGRKGE